MKSPKNKNEASLYLELAFILCSRHRIKMSELLAIADNNYRLRMITEDLLAIEQNIVHYKNEREKDEA